MDNEVRARFFGLSGTVDLCLSSGSACANTLVLQSAPVKRPRGCRVQHSLRDALNRLNSSLTLRFHARTLNGPPQLARENHGGRACPCP